MNKYKWLLAGLLLTQSGCKLIEDVGSVETPEPGQPINFEVTSDTSGATSGPSNPDDPKGSATNPNPGVVAPPPPAIGQYGWREGVGFLINNGASETNSKELLFDFDDYNKWRMKISTNENCEGGNWEDFVPQKTVISERINQILTYSVKYLDYEYSETECYKSQIVHDTEGPTILFAKYPNQILELGATSEMVVNISDRLTSVKSATCKLMSAQETIEKPCSPGTNSIVISPLPEGLYSFVVYAEDILGNKSAGEAQWEVASTTRQLSQSIQVNDYKKVDILFVIDNSGSMAYEQRNMASRVANFLSVIRGLDYQIGVTTTDPRSSVVWGDGQLLPFSENIGSVLDISTPESIAQELIGKTLQRKETGSGLEQAIYATNRVINRYSDNQGPHRKLFREGAQFAVINISDEDESANGPQNDPENLIKLVHDTFGGQKTFSFHSIITKPGDTQCKSTYGATYGERYKKLSDLTGGIVGSVCEQDYAAQVTGIAQGVRNLLKTMTLQCQPLTTGHSITIKRDGHAFADPFRVDGVNLIFDQELGPGNYVVDYRCLK